MSGEPWKAQLEMLGGLAAVRARTWDAALGRLADGWQSALAERSAAPARRAA